jgi:hypothetical protein
MSELLDNKATSFLLDEIDQLPSADAVGLAEPGSRVAHAVGERAATAG